MIEAIKRAEGDMLLGARQGNEDLAIAALVVAPFTLALGVFVSWFWAPNYMAVLVFIVAQIVATVWNAGWRARDE